MENRQDREEVAAAFNQIYDETSQKVLVYITARCSSTDQIGDLFQETYMELYRVLSRPGPRLYPEAGGICLPSGKTEALALLYSEGPGCGACCPWEERLTGTAESR